MGGSVSYFDAGYGGYKVLGAVGSVNFAPLIWDRVGLVGEGRWLTMNASHGFAEYNYLAGPVYRIPLSGQRSIHPYVKGLIGEGSVDFPYHLAYGRYFVFAPGGGVDLPLSRRLLLRTDYEYQIWPQVAGDSGSVRSHDEAQWRERGFHIPGLLAASGCKIGSMDFK